jgi:hypothetical protein
MTKKPPKTAPCREDPMLIVDKNATPQSIRKTMQAATLSPEWRAADVTRTTAPRPMEFDYLDSVAILREQAEAVNAGDMRHVEAMLINQAVALEGVFVDLVRKASLQTTMPHIEGFMKLALRAQNQSRATLETLGNIKQPRAVFVKQANIAHGHQQVNNAHACENIKTQKEQNELLEVTEYERMDTRTQSQAGGNDSSMEAVGTKHRRANSPRQSKVKP